MNKNTQPGSTTPAAPPLRQPRSSRQRYRRFVEDYKQQRLDDLTDAKDGLGRIDPAAEPGEDTPGSKSGGLLRGKRREYLRDYMRWLWPHRYGVGALMLLALFVAGLEMAEPLFMRYIIDRVLLNAELDSPSRLTRLHVAGALFVGVIILSRMIGVLKDYRQRLLNVKVMLSLRRSLFDRLLHLPLPKIWDMKTGGILSRLTGDVDTTTGLLQMAIVSPAVSVIRLIIAVGVLLQLNWRLALTALAIIPGVILVSFISARRIRPIYRSLRKDVEQIDGRVGETFSGIRVVRAFRRELRELLDYMRGRHTILRKELFAHRRELSAPSYIDAPAL
jgi:ATP-binding cassette subfamily B protein/subfamily B ATP-binding cassette protein MsbA